MERVGVGFLTINGPDRVHRAVKAVLVAADADGVPRPRICVVDDGSSELSKSLIGSLSHTLGFDYLVHPRNLGISAGWNHLMERLGTNCDTVLVLNDDLFVTPGIFSAFDYWIKTNPTLPWGTVSPWLRYQGKVLRLRAEPDWEPNRPLLSLSPCGAAFFLRTPTWQKVGPFDETFKSFYEEYDFGLRCVEKGLGCYHLPWPVVDHGWSQTFVDNADMLKPTIRLASSKR